ncbi:MAG: hypothetical protein FD170_976 [Bacteroidetes bacterium]|nr:MAG: hypothetical protein FD170_976 [Bacteroidota bacterium]
MNYWFRFSLILLLWFVISAHICVAQTSEIKDAEKSMMELLKETRQEKSDSARIILNEKLVLLLAKTLSIQDSYQWPFDSLNIGKLKSTDNKIRIFNWNIQQNDRTNLYSMVMLNIEKNKVIVFKTIPSLQKLDDIEVYKDGNWPGGLFYKIIERKDGPKNFYILLSWDGFSPQASRKSIDALSFDTDGMPVFGAPVFKTKEGLKNRVVSEYAATSAFTQTYDRQKITLSNVRKSQRKIDDEIIVLDRLVPMSEALEGQRWAYVPAGNIYDGYVYFNNYWTFVEDIAPRNPAEAGKKPSKKPVSYDLFPEKQN